MRTRVAKALRRLAAFLAPEKTGQVPPQRLRILVAEDDHTAALSLTASLAKLGHEVVGLVDTEEDAVADAADMQPDMLVFDFRLRIGDGVSAWHAIRSRRPVPCLFVSATPDEVRGLQPDAVVISKPALPASLEAGIRRAIARGP